MSKKILLSVLLLFALSTSAFAKLPLELWVTHQSIADIADGKLDFSNARYFGVFFAPHDTDNKIPPDVNLKGTMNVSGVGGYILCN